MKRMSELKDNLRGVKCDATKEAFNYLKAEKRRPRILEMPTARYIRVHIDGKKYDYSPTTGAWCPTSDRGRQGRWRESQSVEEFYLTAVNMSAGIYPPSQKQIDFLESLERFTGQDATPSAWADIKTCSEEIDRLKGVKEEMVGREREPKAGSKPRISSEEWQVVLFLHECQSELRSPSISEVAIRLGTDKLRATTIVNTLKTKRIVGGISSSIWLFGSYNATHSA